MRDIVIIGGGLAGLAAAYELEKSHFTTTLIEVKRQLGGGIATLSQDGFIFDSGKMTHEPADKTRFESFLEHIGLTDDLIPLDNGHIAFANGTGALVDALEAKITATIMKRMAVSTLGEIDDGGPFSICMENGMMLDTHALIIATPARYAERMLYTMVQEAAYKLLNYPYETIARVSLGYEHLSSFKTWEHQPISLPAQDADVVAIRYVSHPRRNPKNGGILQADIRYDPAKGLPDDSLLINHLVTTMDLPEKPAATHMGVWPESDPIMYRQTQHIDTLTAIQAMLPKRVALAGSDYIPTSAPPRLDERIQQGIAAAKKIVTALR